MVSAAIDHMVSITIFLAALLLFINLFSQTNQTAVIYEQHRAVATKCSDLLDNMLLNPGSPFDWGQSSGNVTGFGVQDPEFTEYQASPFSLMRLAPYSADTVVYDKTVNAYYSDASTGFGTSLLMSKNVTLSYSSAQELLGIDNSYGFQLTLTPTVNVSIVDDYDSAQNFLRLNVTLSGTGFPLANAALSYVLILVSLPSGAGAYPSYTMRSNSTYADAQGFASIIFQNVNQAQCYAFIAYAHLSGLVGVGYHLHVFSTDQFVVPIVEELSQQGGSVALAHNYDLNYSGPAGASLKYNVTFVLLAEDFTLREMSLPDQNTTGTVYSGVGNPYPKITLPANTTGILIVPYQQVDNATKGGVVLMPWGISALAFPVTFGDNPLVQEWVATDMRQVIVNHVSYQAKLMLWSSGSQQVMG